MRLRQWTLIACGLAVLTGCPVQITHPSDCDNANSNSAAKEKTDQNNTEPPQPDISDAYAPVN